VGSGFDTLGEAANGLSNQAAFSAGAWALALVFLASAVPKLRKPELAAMAMVDFGVITKPRPIAGTALGAGEVALALALSLAACGGSTVIRVVPVALAAGALWVFSVLILRSLRSSDRFECFCFGEGGEISGATLARTSAMAVVASVFAVAAPSVPSGVPGAEAALLSLIVAASVLGVTALLSTLPTIREVTS